MFATVAIALAAVLGSDSKAGVYSAVVDDVRHTLNGVRSVRVFVADTTEILTAAKLERLAADGPKDDPPNAMALARREIELEKLLAAGATGERVPNGPGWIVKGKEPRLRCSGVNWEMERDVFIRFSRPAFVAPDRALVYAYTKDCISFGHDLIVLERRGATWKVVMRYQIAGAGE
jgi:hypothetical protein